MSHIRINMGEKLKTVWGKKGWDDETGNTETDDRPRWSRRIRLKNLMEQTKESISIKEIVSL